MQVAKILILVFGHLAAFNIGVCQPVNIMEESRPTNQAGFNDEKRKMNFFIISKPKKGKIDLASRFNIMRGKVKGLFRRKVFVAIVARDTKRASIKVQRNFNKYNGLIGTLWFDSHEMYKKGIPCFL